MKTKLVLVVALLASAVGLAETVEIGGVTWTYKVIKDVSGNNCIQLGDGTTLGVTGVNGEVTIPNIVTHEGTALPVRKLGDGLFSGLTDITHVIIPDNVRVIGKSFENCTGLETVDLHDGVYDITGSFYGCTSLTSVTSRGGAVTPSSDYIANHKTAIIGINAFHNCKSLVRVPDYLFRECEKVGVNAFRECAELEGDLELPKVSEMSAYAFYKCKKITSITATNVVTAYYAAFAICESVTNMVMPLLKETKSYYNIGQTFRYLSNLKQIELPSLIKLEQLDLGNAGATNVFIPRVESIGNQAFIACNSLKEFVIPPGVTTLGDKVFDQSKNLGFVKIPYRTSSIGTTPFVLCKVLTNIAIHVSSILDETTLKSNLTRTDLVITRYGGVEEIGGITWAWDDRGEDGVIVLGATGATGNVTIPKRLNGKRVKAIEGYAFDKNTDITSVVIPSTVRSVGICAFRGCTSLTKISVSAQSSDLIDFLSDEYGAEKVKSYSTGFMILVR